MTEETQDPAAPSGEEGQKLYPDGYTRFKEFSPEQMQYVNDHLKRGAPVLELVRVIKLEWKLFADVADKTLHQQLNRYKIQHLTVETERQSLELVRTKRKIEKLSPLERMVALFEIQEGRLQNFLDKEAKLGMPMPGVDKTVTDMMAMLGTIQKTRFDLGLDTFLGPQMVGGKQVTRSVTNMTLNADGSVSRVELTEAVTEATQILRRGLIGVTDVDVKEINGGA